MILDFIHKKKNYKLPVEVSGKLEICFQNFIYFLNIYFFLFKTYGILLMKFWSFSYS